ncbi:MAG TPA: carbohydrate kinase family protein [Bryobacteraceae bacterium]|nr:carbohydrate kinase family protein [Bryobacteraceae bacterium]
MIPDVVVAGELFADLILSGFSEWPQPGKEIFAKEFRREIGGGTAITACGLAKLGSRVAAFGIVGNEWGDWVREELTRRKVATEWIEFDGNEPTAFTVIATTPQDRAFLTYCGANRGFEPSLKKALKENRFAQVRHIHLAYPPAIETAMELFEQLHRNGSTLSLDVGWREEWIKGRRVLELLRQVDFFFPNEVEARHLTGQDQPQQILGVFRSAGLKRVALKLGARGAALLWDDEMHFVEAHQVRAVDTTGAGDCFDAGFLHGWLSGKTPLTCLYMASICGALSTTEYGGIAGFPAPAHLNHELQKLNLCAK